MSEPDKKHEVRTIFSLVDEVSEKSEHMAEKMEKAKVASERMNQGLERLVGPGLALVGLGLGAGELAHKLYEASEAASDAKSRLSALTLQSGRFSKLGEEANLAQTLRSTAEEYENIEKMAGKGYTATANYFRLYETLAGPAKEYTKASKEDIEDLTKAFMPTMMAVTGSFEGAATQAQMLGGALAGWARPPKELLRATHMTRKEWEHLQKQGPDKLFRKVKEELEKSAGPMSKLFSGPGLALTRIRNSVEAMMTKLGEPVMTELGIEAEKLAKWMDENKDAVKEMGEAIAGNVVTGIHVAIDAAKILSNHWKLILGGMAAIKMTSTAIAMAPAIAKILPGLVGSAKAIGNFNAGLYGASNGLTQASSGWAKLAGVMGTVGLATTVFTLGYKMGTFIDELTGASDGIANWLGKVTGQTERLKGIENAGADIAKSQLEMRNLNVATKTAELMKAKHLSRGLARWAAEQELVYKRDPAQLAADIARMSNQRAGLNKTGEFAKGWKPEKPLNQFDFRGSKFDIKQAFAEGFDPDRIAVAFTNDLASYGERRVQSSFSPLFSVR